MPTTFEMKKLKKLLLVTDAADTLLTQQPHCHCHYHRILANTQSVKLYWNRNNICVKNSCCTPKWLIVNFLQSVQLHLPVRRYKPGSQCDWKQMPVTCGCPQVTERTLSPIHTEAGLRQCLCSVPNTVTIKTYTNICSTTDILQFINNKLKILKIAIKNQNTVSLKYNHQRYKN